MLSITSDYVQSEGDPQPYLRQIAEAGFTHVHWCHHWATDFIYADAEIEQIGNWLKEYGLRLLNLHSSQGKEKYWCSQTEYQRLSGVELVQNRIQMARRLGADVVIVHIPTKKPREERPTWLQQIRRSLDQVETYARSHSVHLAVENMPEDDWEILDAVLQEYEADYLGLCYDSGHGNLGKDSFVHLEQWKERLIAVHLHDNDGIADQHKIPFSGTVDWEQLTNIMATSAYNACINLEAGIHKSGYNDEAVFLRQAYVAGERLAAMVEAHQAIP